MSDESETWVSVATKRATDVPDAVGRVDRFLSTVPGMLERIPMANWPRWLVDLTFEVRDIYSGYVDAIERDKGVVTAIDSTDWSIRWRMTESPFLLGVAMEGTPIQSTREQADFAAHLVRMTRQTAKVMKDDPSQEGFYDLAYNLLQLRGYLWGAVAPGRSQSWLEAWTSDQVEDAVTALLVGTAAYNDHSVTYGKETGLRTAGEPVYSTSDLITWLRAAWTPRGEVRL